MENAAKALIMAAGVLIAMLMLTVFMYMYTRMRESTSDIYSALTEPEIAKFNQKFLAYEGRGVDGKNYMNIQDVVTLINLVKNNNLSDKSLTKISFYLDDNPINIDDYDYVGNLETEKDKEYICEFNYGRTTEGIYINPETKLVERINIKEKS